MDARPYLEEITGQFALIGLKAILVGNSAAALQGAPVTTLDFDFLIPRSLTTFTKLKQFAKAKNLVVYRPMTRAPQSFRLLRDRDQFQLDFHVHLDGIASHRTLATRASSITFGGRPLLVSNLADVIISKRAAGRPQDLAIMPTLEDALTPPSRPHAKRPNLKEQFEIIRIAMFDSWLALPPERRTNFLRKRIGICSSAL